jgi:predicted nuclease of predicted toxin-antitoxin system
LRFLIDECISAALLQTAYDEGHEAYHVTRLGKSGASDPGLVRYAFERDLVIVTNNARDFRRLIENLEIHSGLLVIVPNARLEAQRELFGRVLTWLKQQKRTDLVNQVVEVDFEGVRVYHLPASA